MTIWILVMLTLSNAGELKIEAVDWYDTQAKCLAERDAGMEPAVGRDVKQLDRRLACRIMLPTVWTLDNPVTGLSAIQAP